MLTLTCSTEMPSPSMLSEAATSRSVLRSLAVAAAACCCRLVTFTWRGGGWGGGWVELGWAEVTICRQIRTLVSGDQFWHQFWHQP